MVSCLDFLQLEQTTSSYVLFRAVHSVEHQFLLERQVDVLNATQKWFRDYSL